LLYILETFPFEKRAWAYNPVFDKFHVFPPSSLFKTPIPSVPAINLFPIAFDILTHTSLVSTLVKSHIVPIFTPLNIP